MTNLKNGPQDLVSLLALMRGVLGVLHLVAELEQRIFQVVEAVWRRFTVARRSYGRHSWCVLKGRRRLGRSWICARLEGSLGVKAWQSGYLQKRSDGKLSRWKCMI